MEPQPIRQIEPGDAELFMRLRGGDPEALNILCQRHGGFVRTVIRACWSGGDELDDLCQVCWLRIWQKASGLRDADKWRPWLTTIARNTARDGMRKARRREKLTQGLAQRAGAAEPTNADPPPGRQEQQEAVVQALAQMPEKYRLPLMLRLVERWSYEQIGQAIGLRRGGVESRLYRARKKLASLLKAGASWETHK